MEIDTPQKHERDQGNHIQRNGENTTGHKVLE